TDRQIVRETHVAREERRSILRRIQVAVVAASSRGEAATAEFERRDILQEEIAGLGLEEIEPRGVDLEEIERAIREIRIDGQRAGELRRDLIKGVAAGTETEGFVLGLLPVKAIAQRAVNLDVETEPLIDAFEPGEGAGAGDVGRL